MSDSDDSVTDPDFIEHLDHISDHEVVNDLEKDDDLYDTDDSNVATSEIDFYLGKDNKTKWLKIRLAKHTKKRTRNVITQRSSVNLIANMLLV